MLGRQQAERSPSHFFRPCFSTCFRFYFYCLPATLVRGHRMCLALAQHQNIQRSWGDPGPPHQPLHSLSPTVKDSVLLLPPSSADGSQQPARTANQSPLQDKSLLSASPHELAESETFLCGQKEHSRKRELLNASQSEAGEAAAFCQLLDPRKQVRAPRWPAVTVRTTSVSSRGNFLW